MLRLHLAKEGDAIRFLLVQDEFIVGAQEVPLNVLTQAQFALLQGQTVTIELPAPVPVEPILKVVHDAKA